MILKKEEIKKIEDYLKKIYGDSIKFNEYLVLKTGNKERIWMINKKALEVPLQKFRINSVGLYIGRWDRGKFRLSIEGAMLLNPKKNFVVLDYWKDFVRGFDIKINCNQCDEDQYVIVKYKRDTLGIAKYHRGVLENVLPKGRKLKKLSYL